MGPETVKLLILIVEDDAATREMYELILEDAGFRCAAVSTGRDGIAMAASLQPDIILTDVGIPGPLDGCAMTRLLKSNNDTCRIPVVAVTGYDARDVRRAAAFEEVLTKPIVPYALAGVLRSVLARARSL